MSEFNFKGNVQAINQQVGDYNQMCINGQNIEIDWGLLTEELELLEGTFYKGDKVLYNKCKALVEKKNKTGLSTLLKTHFQEFGKSVLSSLTAGALIEVVKVLL